MALSPEDDLMQALTSEVLFSSHPLADSDPFTPLLARFLPLQARPQPRNYRAKPADTTDSLITEGRWQTLANRMAEEILDVRGTRSNTLQDVEAVLSKWAIRLQCLRRLQRLNMLVSEANALFGTLPQLYTLPSHVAGQSEEPIFESYIPFNLVLLQAVLPTYLNDDQYVVLTHLQEISWGCKLEYRRTRASHWVTRLRTTAIAMVNVLYTLGETRQAMDLLHSIAEAGQGKDTTMISAVCMLAMTIGDMQLANSILDQLKSVDETSDEYKSMEVAKLLCDGEYKAAEETARGWFMSSDNNRHAKVTLSACCLYSEKVQEGIDLLESLARTEPEQFYNSETNISNLISLQELQAGDHIANKLDLLKECSRYATESLSLGCLRL